MLDCALLVVNSSSLASSSIFMLRKTIVIWGWIWVVLYLGEVNVYMYFSRAPQIGWDRGLSVLALSTSSVFLVLHHFPRLRKKRRWRITFSASSSLQNQKHRLQEGWVLNYPLQFYLESFFLCFVSPCLSALHLACVCSLAHCLGALQLKDSRQNDSLGVQLYEDLQFWDCLRCCYPKNTYL